MKRSTLVVEWFVLIFLVLGTAASPAGNSSLTLGSATGIPAGEIHLPIYLTLSSEQQFERITAMIDYPPTLTYSRAEAAKDTPANNISIAVIEPPPQSGAKRKRVAITLTGEKGKSLPTGVVALLFFKVDKKAIEQMMSLPLTEVNGFAKGSGAEVKLQGNSGEVVIYESMPEKLPVLGCFFFTH